MEEKVEKLMKSLKKLPVSVCRKVWRVGRDDPRRIIHALKVGLALTLVSFLYLLEPLFEGVGQNAMWAVITVVVVLEFTAGATLCKGLNRGFGTLCAGSLAFFIEFMAEQSGKVFRAIFIGTSVFLIGFLSTYLRFFPYIKKNFDYGVVIFLLTFNLITVSSYRVQNVIHIARERLYTIAIGCGICLFMSLLVFPNWSGEDLHNSTVKKFEALARSIEGCINEYFQEKDEQESKDKVEDPIYRGYRAVLDSKSSDETLATFASWEPRHNRHCHKDPWKQYVKLGAVLRHFGYTAVALHGCLQSEIQAPKSVRALFRDPCIRVASEVSKVLVELADSIRNRRHFSHDVLSDHLQEALQDLNSAIKSQPRLFLGSKNNRTKFIGPKHEKEPLFDVAMPSLKTDTSALLEWKTNRVTDQPKEPAEQKQLRPTLSKIAITSLEFSEALPFAAFASLLVEMVARLELVIEEVQKLGRAAQFREFTCKDEIAIKVNDENRKHVETSHDLNTHEVHQIVD
ncbi:Aluminum-activated malate transporter 12 [Apostasia shenzhenica]|uniref:Aluminum-activated malate transporter 12 n=1 Tax=Apostasia shenzhenica TaxID=1088818 RepID=A0A2I0AWZ5_9ASPA|nr:Aluminum-activated malate transporter 12 [Apostasia shenzhenica]